MKFALLSGAYKNAGDYLIVKRCKELLDYVYPNCLITEYERRKPLGEHIDEINTHDYLIIAGGPAYRKNLYPDIVPLVPDLGQIKIPIITLGVGQRCVCDNEKTIYNYRFDSDTRKLLDYINGTKIPFSCRDWSSVRILRNNGYSNTVMTGCTAWYDVSRIDMFECNIHSFNEVKKVYLSDPALIQNFRQICGLIDLLKNKNKDIKIVMVFHRGITADENTNKQTAKAQQKLIGQLKAKGVEYRDISYSAEGFKIYNDCDLHIGYRVHAHLYNMSVRKASILIQEDSRGDGANEALGLPSLRAYNNNCHHLWGKLSHQRGINFKYWGNKFLISEINNYLLRLEEQKYRSLEWAYIRMNETFGYMLQYIRSLGGV